MPEEKEHKPNRFEIQGTFTEINVQLFTPNVIYIKVFIITVNTEVSQYPIQY